MYVKVRASDSSDWVSIRSYRYRDNHSGYTRQTIDLSAYKGQSIQLRFEQWSESANGPRTWLIDDLFIGEDPVPPELGYPYSNDFESTAEQEVWNLQSSWGFLDNQGDHTSHSGSYHLDSNSGLIDQRYYQNNIYATLNGQITVPVDATRPVVSFWYNLSLLDGDYMYVKVRASDSSDWVSIRSYRYRDIHSGYTRETIDLSAYKGQSIQLRFEQWTGSGYGHRYWLIDELFVGEDPVPPELGFPYSNDFESTAEQAIWNLQSSWGFLDNQGDHTSHSGTYHLDSNSGLIDQRYYQHNIHATLNGQITIPVDSIRPVVRFWYNLSLLDGDYMYVKVRASDSSDWITIRSYRYRDFHDSYTRETIDLSAYKGQSIQLRFEQWTGSGYGHRYWLIDELFVGEEPVLPELGYPYSNDFESAAEQGVWNLQSSWGFLDSQGDHTSHSGVYHLDSNPGLINQRYYEHTVYATLYGQITVPTDAILPVISYWYRLQLLDGDYMKVEVRTPDTPEWTKVRQFSVLDNNGAYVREDLDLSPYLGQSIQIRFQQWTGSGSGLRMWLLDGLRVGVSSTYDQDGDGTPDFEDPDRDGDGVANEADAFPDNKSEWSDLDGDGIGDNSDPDRDGDGVENLSDLFPNDPAEWADLDGDGIGDNGDTDRDGDGLGNSDEELTHGTDPLKFDTDGDGLSDGAEVLTHGTDPNAADSDLDGLSDYEEVTNLHTDPNLADSDGDGLSDSAEVLTHVTNPLNADTDGDGLNDGDEISHGTNPFQVDTDGDGFSDKLEIDAGYNPTDGTSIPPDLDLDGIPDVLDDDRDGDGVNNDLDAFPDDATESADLDGDGIGDNSDPDRDGDGVANDLDLFPNDPTESSDLDGDGIGDNSDPDRDGDGVNNDIDVFPDDPTESSDLDGNGIGDNSDPDRDGDGFSNEDEVAAGTDPDNALDYPDLIAPAMTLDGVSERTTEANSIDLSGSVSDENSGLDSVIALSDQYPGVPMAVILSGGQWSLNVPLEVGPNQITLTASDLAGNTTELIVNVERLSTDATLALVIEQPVNGSVMNQPSLVIRGILRNELPAQSQTVTVAGTPVALTPTSLTTEFRFESSTLELVEGINTFQIQAEADGQSVTSSVSVTYQPELVMPDAPVFRILSPAEGSYLAEEGFTLVGEVFAPGGLTSLSLDGVAIPFTTLQGGYYSFSEAIGFAVGADSLSMLLLAEDEEGQTSQLQIDYLRDQTAPVLVLDTPLSAAPTENGVTQHPYRLRGSLSDDNLAGFDINGTPVSLLPGDLSGEYRFDVALELSPGTPMSLLLTARDQADNINQQEYILRLDASLSVSMLLPAAGTELVHSNAPIALQVAVEVSGTGAADAIAEALLVDGSGTTVASTTLTGASGLKSGEISVPALAEQYDINIVITNSASDVLAETSRSLTVRDPVVVPLALERTEPANGEVGVEPNGFIGLYFNQPIDISKLSVSLHETAQGYTYENLDAPGTPTLNARGYQLVEVNRSHEAVPGQLSLLPGDQVVAFYPERELAYGGEVYLDVSYDGSELGHLLFHTRPLPTFINGSVIDQFSQPVEGVTVTLPALGRTTKTNRDGAFAFGYGDLHNEALPAGRYELVVNPSLKEVRFGTVQRWIAIEAGRQNRLDVTRLSLLNQDIPFVPLEGRGIINMLGGELILDLNNADLQFPDQRRTGDIHLQLTEYGQFAYPIGGDHLPHWLYIGQPAGIRVEGELRIDMATPQLNRSYDYLPADGSHVLMMGFDPASRHIVPVGVGRLENYRVISAGLSHYQSLDAIGYVLQGEAAQPHLQAYVDGEIDLQALLIALKNLAE